MKKKNEKSKRLFTYKQTAFLYLLCGICWIVSGILNIMVESSYTFDFVVGIIFIIFSVLYLMVDKKSKK